jgi:catechol 2,3-dioxygenase-like lactoylglutathione lyase family enzyme
VLRSIEHISIQASDFDQAFHFYTQILGLSVCVPPFSYKSRRLCYLDAGKIRIELYSIKPGEDVSRYCETRCGLDHLAFVTDALSDTIERLRQRGVRVLKSPFVPASGNAEQVPIAFIEGPDGQVIEIMQGS